MDYHFLLFDYRNMLKWYRGRGADAKLTSKRTANLMTVLRTRPDREAEILNEALEVRRKILRFDYGRAVVVYYVRFHQEPDNFTKRVWTNRLDDAKLWARFEKGHIVERYPWTEYVGTPEEYQRLISMAKRVNESLQWPIRDPECLALIQRTSGPSSSATGPITGGSGTTPQAPIVHGVTTAGPITTDSPHEDVEMESPITPPFSPILPSRSPEPAPVAPSVVSNEESFSKFKRRGRRPNEAAGRRMAQAPPIYMNRVRPT